MLWACTGGEAVETPTSEEAAPAAPATWDEAIEALPPAVGIRWKLARVDDSDTPELAVFRRSGLRGELKTGLSRITETLVGWGQLPSYTTAQQGEDLVVVVGAPGKGGPLTIARAKVVLAAELVGGEVPAHPEGFEADAFRGVLEASLGVGKLMQLTCDEHPCLAVLQWSAGDEAEREAWTGALDGYGEPLIHDAGVVLGPQGPVSLVVASWGAEGSERLTARATSLAKASKNAAKGLRP